MHHLTPKQLRCATLLATGHTGRSAAKELGVTPQTVSAWGQMAPFRAVVAKQLEGSVGEAHLALTAIQLRAVERLSELISCKSPAVSLRACGMALRLGQAARQYVINPDEDDDFGSMAAYRAVAEAMRAGNVKSV